MVRRFYLAATAAFCLVGAPVAAQQAERPTLGSTLTAPILADLPTGSSVYSMFDGALPEVIADRADTGGLYSGEPARVGSHGSSWTQTMFRLGDADITSPGSGGTPMLIPRVLSWDRVEVNTGLMPIETNAPGMAVTLVPRRPSNTWTSQVEAFGTGPSLLARQLITVPPALATQHTWVDGNVLISGPVVPGRIGLTFAGGYTTSSRFERDDRTLIFSDLATAFAHVLFTPGGGNEVRVIGWVEHAAAPYANRLAFAQPTSTESSDGMHGQWAWEHKVTGGSGWTLFNDVTRRRHQTDLGPTSSLVIERLTDGPVPELFNPHDASELTWSVGARANSALFRTLGASHIVRGGVSFAGASVTAQSTFNGRVGELIAGTPARVWDYTSPAGQSQWSDTLLAVYGADTLRLHPRLTLEAGVRFEVLRASAGGSVNNIQWRNWLPRANLRWDVVDFARIALVTGFARYGNRLPLNDLAYGDPVAPYARVYRWNTSATSPRLADLGPLVARVGPGTGGDDRFVTIDPQIVRPYMDEFIAGFESRPRANAIVRLVAIARREKQVLGVVDVGVPESAYITSFVTDPGDDHAAKQQLPVYNRAPATFGLDRYLLTNPADNQATFVGTELTMQVSFDHPFEFFMAGATAGRSEALSANVGFKPLENDHGVLGDVFIDPNARTFAQGRVFSERGYTIKTAGIFRLPGHLKLGYVARYQDGQHFARLLVVPGLNQGAEAVRAFRNGATRFTYTGTLDARLQRTFTVSSQPFTLLLDGYNLLNMATEIEEFSVTGPTSRLTSATQPPRTLHVGLRLSF